MKIERVNENQIRCTLTREDLISRDIKLSELAYGTDKAKTLFRDMMQMASRDFGFEAEEVPLMIEAIPLNADCIVLIITKVEDPEELDTRFSKFAPSVTEEDDLEDILPEDFGEAMDTLSKPVNTAPVVSEEISMADLSSVESKEPEALCTVFRALSMQQVISAARLITKGFRSESSLYKGKDGAYFLLLQEKGKEQASFRKACNTLSEYGLLRRGSQTTRSFLSEHCETLIAADAIHVLGNL